MLKHKKIMAILLSLMMVLCLTPSIAFAEGETPSITINGGNDITASVGETTVEAQINNVDKGKKYHVHWSAHGKTEGCSFSTNGTARKLTITTETEYGESESTTLTAYLCEGDSCTDELYNVAPCGTALDTKQVNFKAVKGSDFNSMGLKINDELITSGTKEKPAIKIDRWKETYLTASTEDSKSYNYSWEKTDGKEAINFIVDGKEQDNTKYTTANGNTITVKGLVEEKVKISVTATKKNNGDKVGTVSFWIEVVSNMKYGQQGSKVSGYKDAQTVEIVKIGDIIVTDADITGTKGINDPGETFTNSITNPFAKGKDAVITFFIGKGMGKKFSEEFSEEEFKQAAIQNIEVLNKEGKRIDGLTGIELFGRNIDRSITVQLPTGQLEEGKYILRFNKDLAPQLIDNGGQPLGVDVDFWFTVGDPVPVIGDYDVISKVEINKNEFVITQDLKDIGIDTKEEVLNAMYEAAVKLIAFDVNGDNSVVYDVILLIKKVGDEKWMLATKENFPKEGIKLELDYPEGTSAETQDFEVLHMATYNTSDDGTGLMAGDVEKLNVKEGKDKLQVTVNSLSPFMIAWQDADAEAGINDGSAKTGDNMNIALYAGIMILALCGGAAVFARRRKEQ